MFLTLGIFDTLLLQKANSYPSQCVRPTRQPVPLEHQNAVQPDRLAQRLYG